MGILLQTAPTEPTTEEPTNTPTTGRSTTPDPNGFECPPDVEPTEYPYPGESSENIFFNLSIITILNVYDYVGNCSLYYFCFDDGSFEVGVMISPFYF